MSLFDFNRNSKAPEIISARKLIQLVGWLGFLFPIILIIGAVLVQDCSFVQNSISDYYHTLMRNVFVGVLWAIAFCFLAYKGYCETDSLTGTFAGLCAIGVSLAPTSTNLPVTECVDKVIDNGIIGNLHLVFATLLFLTLAYFSLCLFPKTHKDRKMTAAKGKRNIIYKICGFLILVFIAFIAAYWLFIKTKFPDMALYRPVFWLETLALWAFSLSWLTKGEVLYADPVSKI